MPINGSRFDMWTMSTCFKSWLPNTIKKAYTYKWFPVEEIKVVKKMEMKIFSFNVIAVALLIVANSGLMHTRGHSVSCLNQLAPCLNYLSGTKEMPQVCCNPLKSVIKNNPECLCRMISNRGNSQAEQADINVNDAQMLPARCGEHFNLIACLTRLVRTIFLLEKTNVLLFFQLKYVFVSILCLMQDLEDLLTRTEAPPLTTPFLSPFRWQH